MLIAIRYVLPALMFCGSMAMLVIAPNTTVGLEGFCMGLGATMALLLINFLWRMGFEGDKDRLAEEEARRYLMTHGHWPDDED